MPTKVLVFESDAGFAEQLRLGLAEFACDTTVVDDASVGLQTAARVKPDLILLAIELPRMNGFSVCNKLKRDPGLKDVPLIIMSTDSTEETFEQHRRLRTRAEDYVKKPVAFPVLLGRIQSFVPLAPSNDSDDIILEEDIEIEDTLSDDMADMGIEIAEAEVYPEAQPNGEAHAEGNGAVHAESGGVSQAESNAEVYSDVEVASYADSTTDAYPEAARLADEVYEALHSKPPDTTDELEIAEADVLAEEREAEPTLEDQKPAAVGTNPPSDPVSGPRELVPMEPLGLADFEDSPTELSEPSVLEEAMAAHEEPASRRVAGMGMGLGIIAEEPTKESAVASIAPASQSSPPAMAPRASSSPRVSEVAAPLPGSIFPLRPSSTAPRPLSRPPDAEITRLREEVERHRARTAELEESSRAAHARIAELEEASRRGASKDQEVQRLQRELDEAKARFSSGKGGATAREFLDLREQLNRKDKELIDLRDQLTHKEKELQGARDGVAAIEREKVRAQERVVELEKAQAELARANEAYKNDKEAASKRADDFKRKSEKLKVDLDAKTQEFVELKQQYDAELASRVVREAEAAEKARAELEQAVASTQTEERAKAEQALAEAVALFETEQARLLELERNQAESAKQEALAAREAELTAAHELRLAAQQSESNELVASLRAEHERTLAEAARAAADQLTVRESELDIAHRRELDQLRSYLEARIAELEQTIAGLERDLAQRTAQRDDARRDVERRVLRLEGLETDLASVRSKLEATSATLLERERALETLGQDFAAKSALASDLAARLEQTSQRLAAIEVDFSTASGELEQTRAALRRDEEILSRARAKSDGDRASLERAKDALAAVLAQIDEIDSRTFE